MYGFVWLIIAGFTLANSTTRARTANPVRSSSNHQARRRLTRSDRQYERRAPVSISRAGPARDRQARAPRLRALAVRCGRHRYGDRLRRSQQRYGRRHGDRSRRGLHAADCRPDDRLSAAHSTGAGAGPLSPRRRRPVHSPCAGVVPHSGGDSIGCWAVALVELDHDLEGDGVR